MTTAIPDFRRGAEAAAEAGKGGGNFPKTHYFGLEDQESVLVRFITDKDDWLVVDQHSSVPTKRQPADYQGQNWPQKMGAVCRKDKALRPVYPDGCYICEHLVDGKQVKKAGGRTWALACLREEVRGDGSPEMGGEEQKGKVLGIRDQTREVAEIGPDGKPTGVTTVEKAIVVVNMGYKNFFASLTGFAGHYGTVLDRDYLIKRNGTDQTTTYSIIPLDPIVMPDGRKYDLRDPEFAARYATDIDIVELLLDRSSDEFYGRFFDPRVEASFKGGSNGGSGSTAASTPPKPSNEPSEDKMAALAARVQDYGSGAAAPAATPAAATTGMRDFG
jgi:hypothetical protein